MTTELEPKFNPAAGHQSVTAAKLHVLRLEPIKAKMGNRWERLAGLVHKLFERSLQQVQGPHDHFLRLDDMSYVVSFHQLSVQEAGLACAAIAKEVCELLFGADIEDTSVRSLIGNVSPALFKTGAAAGLKISALLEDTGGEIIVRHPPASPATARPHEAWTAGAWISKAGRAAEQDGWKLAFFPVWDLHKCTSFSLYASLFSGPKANTPTGVRRALRLFDEAHIVESEVAMLYAAADYAHRLHAANRLCVVGVGVSYETLSGFHTRIRYTTALKAIPTFSECPIMVRLGPIPEGTPLGRIAEIVAMIKLPNVRVSLEFKNPRSLPKMDIRLGAVGIGATLPPDCDPAVAPLIVRNLVRGAAEQKNFAFLHELNSPALLGLARDSGIRVGTGQAIGDGRRFNGLESAPQFPLVATTNRWEV